MNLPRLQEEVKQRAVKRAYDQIGAFEDHWRYLKDRRISWEADGAESMWKWTSNVENLWKNYIEIPDLTGDEHPRASSLMIWVFGCQAFEMLWPRLMPISLAFLATRRSSQAASGLCFKHISVCNPYIIEIYLTNISLHFLHLTQYNLMSIWSNFGPP